MNKLTDYTLTKMLPSNLMKDEFVKALAEATEIQIKEMYREVEDIFDMSNVDKMPERLLDNLAYERSVDFYKYDSDLETKRRIVKSSMEIHRRKGTPYAVELVMQTFGLNGVVTEWWENELAPFHFSVELDISKRVGSIDHIKKMIERYKNVRSVFAGFILVLGCDEITYIDISYHYQLLLKYCNHVYGISEIVYGKEDGVTYTNETYDYVVNYYVNRVASKLMLLFWPISDETYDYNVSLKRCEDVFGVCAGFEHAVHDIEMKDETYNYKFGLSTNRVISKILKEQTNAVEKTYKYHVPYQICGTFNAEE